MSAVGFGLGATVGIVLVLFILLVIVTRAFVI
ncbi:YjcZ family sporulation protein [Paenibacillus hamazuiensis]|nr:YjcZ family sporulation protein [Paenibacillus hamazuiensis]